MTINGETRITGIIGWPVEHSLSPAMHNAAFSALSLNYCYVPFPVRPEALGDALSGLKALNIRGINVTIPHKERVIPFLDAVDTEASDIGAVNTILHDDGRLSGHNTDGKGFMQSLAEKNIDPQDMEILIVGTGGGARAVGYSLAEKAKSITLYGRTADRAGRFAGDLRKIGRPVTVRDDLSQLEHYDMIVHATPLGMRGDDPLPLDTKHLRSGQVVCDLIYMRTKLLDEAAQKGCLTLSGAGMLLWQGVLAFELWTGRKPDVGIMRRALLDAGGG
jgi:shikimate dehydrogenase